MAIYVKCDVFRMHICCDMSQALENAHFPPSQACKSPDPVPPEIAGYRHIPYNTRGHTYPNYFKSGQLGLSRELIINLSWPTC